MKTEPLNLAAAGCAVVYILVYLFLPFASLPGGVIGLPAKDLLQISVWMILPLIAGCLIAVGALILPRNLAIGISVASAIIPPLVFVLMRGDFLSFAGNITGASSFVSVLGSNLIVIGLSVVFDALLAVAAAVLCYLADQQPVKRKESTHGLSSNEDDW